MAISAVTFYSCNDNEAAENQVETKKSFSLRMVLNEIKKENYMTGRSTSTESAGLCFEFVFPLNLSFNNGTVVSVASMDEIVTILANENENTYINGIAFPFQVTTAVSNGTSTVIINNESDFADLIQSCGMENYGNYVTSGMCYEYTFPLSYINQDGATIVSQNEQELFESFQNGNVLVELAFPVYVIYDGQTMTIDNLYELFEMDNNCNSNSCICTQEYAPVCVMSPDGSILHFPNACYAECGGYSSADFVSCTTNNQQGFDGLGTCFTVDYPIEVQYQGAVISVYSDSELLTYLNTLSGATINYPIVIHHATSSMMFTIESEEGLNNVVSQLCN